MNEKYLKLYHIAISKLFFKNTIIFRAYFIVWNKQANLCEIIKALIAIKSSRLTYSIRINRQITDHLIYWCVTVIALIA